MYVDISTVLITGTLATGMFYLTPLCSFIGCFFEYLPLSSLQVYSVSLNFFKKFKAFCPCHVTSQSVKGIYTFWKFRGSIDRFNKSCSQINSGTEQATDESMSDICFHTTPKCDLPYYSHIFMNPEPLGTESNNVACYRLRTILY